MVGPNLDEPRSLNSLNEHKLTRRKVMRAASSVGLSSAVAANMTVEDVKASDSDQVTVSFDISGNSKHTVDADRMEWMARATEATRQVQNKHSGKEGILRIGTRGGGSKDNPHVMVTLDRDSEEKEERRGELAEKKNGVRVETQKDEDEWELHCDPDYWPQNNDLPGGQRVNMLLGEAGTCSCQMLKTDFNWFGWTTSAHVAGDCTEDDRKVQHSADGSSYDIGKVDFVDFYRDVAFISDDYHKTSAWNIKPSDHREGVEINGTVTEEGFSVVDEKYDGQQAVFLYGAGNCFTDFELIGWNEDVSNPDYNCADPIRDQMVVDKQVFDSEPKKGDSGGLYFVEDPDNPGYWYAMGSHNGEAAGVYNRPYGAQGFTLHNIHDRLWKN